MNIVCLVGRLTRDAELRSTATGKNTVSFVLAVKQNFKTDGEYKTDFIRCVAFGHHAEFLSNYGKKGAVVTLKGELRNNNFEKDGVKQYRTEVLAKEIEILNSTKNTSSTTGGPPSPQGEGMMPEMPLEFGADVTDDDLPF